MQSVAQQVVSPRGKEGVVSAGSDHNELAAAALGAIDRRRRLCPRRQAGLPQQASGGSLEGTQIVVLGCADPGNARSEEHTSELQSLMRISYAVFCLTKKHNKDIQLIA